MLAHCFVCVIACTLELNPCVLLCRSPVLSSVSEAINGAATIRAFGITDWLIGRNRALVNKNAVTSLLNQSLNRWLSVRLEGLGALCTLLAALVTVEQQSGRAATMGLLLTYALQVCSGSGTWFRVWVFG